MSLLFTVQYIYVNSVHSKSRAPAKLCMQVSFFVVVVKNQFEIELLCNQSKSKSSTKNGFAGPFS